MAIALSVLIHLVLLALVHPSAEPQPDEKTPPVISLEPPVRTPTPVPTRRPTPAPSPTPHTTPPPRRAAHTPPPSHVHLAHQAAHARGVTHEQAVPTMNTTAPGASGTGAAIDAPAADAGVASSGPPNAPAEATQPAPTPPPSCAQPNVPATTIDAVAPDTPPIAAQAGISGEVTVVVSLDEESRIVEAHVMASPSALLNDAALRAAKASRFRTEIRACRPVAASYAFVVDFTAQ